MEYAFIHIPKCAGFSIKKAIKQHNLPIAVFDHGVRFKNIPNTLKQLIILREPIDRFTSAFYYVVNNLAKNSKLKNPNDFLNDLRSGGEESKKVIKPQIGYHQVNGNKIFTDWVYHPQNAWVDNPHTIMFVDTLQEDFDKLGFNVKLPIVNRSKRIAFEYSLDNLEYLHDWYNLDFTLYNKERNKK